MVKTSDKARATDDLQATLYDGYQILERAILLSGGAPFWQKCHEQNYAQIRIDGAMATLSWPEVHSGYYDSCSIEYQSVSFPSELLLMSLDEIAVWKVAEREKYDDAEKERVAREAKERTERQTALELQTLAGLKVKYGG